MHKINTILKHIHLPLSVWVVFVALTIMGSVTAAGLYAGQRYVTEMSGSGDFVAREKSTTSGTVSSGEDQKSDKNPPSRTGSRNNNSKSTPSSSKKKRNTSSSDKSYGTSGGTPGASSGGASSHSSGGGASVPSGGSGGGSSPSGSGGEGGGSQPEPPKTDSVPSNWHQEWSTNLSHDPGASYTTGVRGTDLSFNTKSAATYGSNGMTITASRSSEGGQITSADVMFRNYKMTGRWAFEAEVTLSNLGPGRFPAVWFRPNGPGQGEMDLFEYCGAYYGTYREMKSTIIRTGTTKYNLGSSSFGIPKSALDGSFEGRHRWGYAYDPLGGTVTLYVDRVFVGQITKSMFDKAAGVDAWDTLAAAWYPRATFQMGPRSDGRSGGLGGEIPSSWRKSTMTIHSMTAYSLH